MKIILLTTYFILFYCIVGYAQSIFSGAENGIGLRHYITTSRGMGMGNAGLSLNDTTTLNAYNTASWRHMTDTKISISILYDYVYTDLGVQNFTSSRTNFSGVQLGIPIQKDHWAIGISVVPYSVINFSYILDSKNQEPYYKANTFYEGNISRPQFSIVWGLNRSMGFSANFIYYFGTIEDRYYLFLDDPDISDTYYDINYRFQGPGLGLSFDLEPKSKWRLGGFIDFPVRVKFKQITFSPTTLEEKRVESKASFPLFWGIGSSYQFHKQWIISTDFAYQDWSKGLEINNIKPENLDKWYNFGLGIEHSRSSSKSKSILNKIDLRTGLSAGSLGYKFNNSIISEYALHFGMGIPFYQGLARLDIAFLAGIRGNKDNTLAEEKFFKLYLSISAGELWFQKIR